MKRLTSLLLGLLFLIYVLFLFPLDQNFFLAPFREAQTAISAYYIYLNNNFSLWEYETPIFGYPWRTPYEFPVYQSIVAIFSYFTKDIMISARVVNLIFFLGCFLVINKIIKSFTQEIKARNIFFILFFSSSIYFVFSQSVQIEIFTLFLALVYFYSFLKYKETEKSIYLFLFFTFSSLTILSKSTTWATWSIAIFLFCLYDIISRKFSLTKNISFLVKVFLTSIVSFSVGYLWISYSGEINEMYRAQFFVEKNSQIASIFETTGTIKERLSLKVWCFLIGKNFLLIFGFLFPIIIFIFIKPFWENIKASKKIRILYLLSFLAYILTPLIFFRYHWRHNYYLIANGLFILIPFTHSLFLLYKKDPKTYRKYIYLILISNLITNYTYLKFFSNYTNETENYIVDNINNFVDEGSIIQIGNGFSSNLAFYTKRKALSLYHNQINLNEVLERNKNINYSLIVCYGREVLDTVLTRPNILGIETSNYKEIDENTWIFAKNKLNLSSIKKRRDLLLEDLQSKIDISNEKYMDLVYKKHSINEGKFEIALKRAQTLFYINILDFKIKRYDSFFLNQKKQF